MQVTCDIHHGIYEVNNKKYMDLALPDDFIAVVLKKHQESYSRLNKKNVRIPLENNILKVKIPFRNNRITCTKLGGKTIYELIPGDTVTVLLLYNGPWVYGDFCGLAWTLNLIETPNLPVPPSS